MAAGLYNIQAPLQWVILSSPPTATFSTLMASSSPSLSSSSQPVTIQTTNNDMIEKGGTPILKPDSKTGKIFFHILWKLVYMASFRNEIPYKFLFFLLLFFSKNNIRLIVKNHFTTKLRDIIIFLST